MATNHSNHYTFETSYILILISYVLIYLPLIKIAVWVIFLKFYKIIYALISPPFNARYIFRIIVFFSGPSLYIGFAQNALYRQTAETIYHQTANLQGCSLIFISNGQSSDLRETRFELLFITGDAISARGAAPWTVRMWRLKLSFCLIPRLQITQMYCGSLPHSIFKCRFRLPFVV